MVASRRRACLKQTVATQTEEVLSRTVAVQVSGCRECQSLLLPGEGGQHSTCVRCEQVQDLFDMVVKLKEEVEMLRTIRECEREIDRWSNTLTCQSERSQGGTPQKEMDLLPSRTEAEVLRRPHPRCCRAEVGDLKDDEGWKCIPVRAVPLPACFVSPGAPP